MFLYKTQSSAKRRTDDLIFSGRSLIKMRNRTGPKTDHQGIGRGRLVPSSHKGSKFRYTIVRQFSRGDERIREDIPIPDSLGKETFQVGIYTSSGNLKDQ